MTEVRLFETGIVLTSYGHAAPDDLPHKAQGQFPIYDSFMQSPHLARMDGPSYIVDPGTGFPKFLLKGTIPKRLRKKGGQWGAPPKPHTHWMLIISPRLRQKEIGLRHTGTGGGRISHTADDLRRIPGLVQLSDLLYRETLRYMKREHVTITVSVSWHSHHPEFILLSVIIGNKPNVPTAQEFLKELGLIFSPLS